MLASRQVGKWPEILNKAIIWSSPSDCWHAMHLQKPSDVCFNPSDGTFYHSLRHARKDLLLTWFATRRIQLIDFNHHFNLFYWIFVRRSFGSPGSLYWTVGLPGTSTNPDAWYKLEKNTEPHGQNLGLRKMEPSLLRTAKVPSLRCHKKPAVPGTACKLGGGCLRGGSCIPCQRIKKKCWLKLPGHIVSQRVKFWHHGKIVEKLFRLRNCCRI